MADKGFSVIIPCFNREATIGQCVESVLSQDYCGNLEIIISDDGSTDRSIEIAKSIDKRVKVIEKGENCNEQGAASARNRALLIAQYEYICFLDSDDYYLPNYLNVVGDYLDTYSHIGYTFCRAKKETLYEENNILGDWTRKKMSILDKRYHVLYRSYNINTDVIVVRKSVIDKVGLFNVSLTNGEDSDMWIRISELTEGKFLDIFGAVYRINHSSQQLTQISKRKKKKCASKIYTEALQRYIETDNNDKLRLLLILRMIFYMKLNDKMGLFFSIYRFLFVSSKLFVLFPVVFFKYILYGAISK